MTKPYGLTIFCDDVRTEDNGKHIYLGIYEGGINVVGPAPVILPSFAFSIRVLEHKNDRDIKLQVRVLMCFNEDVSDEVLVDLEVPQDRWNILDDPNSDPEAQYITSVFILKLSPFRINGSGYIRVRAFQEQEEIKLGSLQVNVTT